MKKILGVAVLMGVILTGAGVYSWDRGVHSSMKPRRMRLARIYCQEVNPQSALCQKWQELHKELSEVRRELWQEMRDYCQKHQDEEFCRNWRARRMGPGSGAWCPRAR